MVRGLIQNQIEKVKSTAEFYKNEAPGWLNKNLNALEEKYPKVKGRILLQVTFFCQPYLNLPAKIRHQIT